MKFILPRSARATTHQVGYIPAPLYRQVRFASDMFLLLTLHHFRGQVDYVLLSRICQLNSYLIGLAFLIVVCLRSVL